MEEDKKEEKKEKEDINTEQKNQEEQKPGDQKPENNEENKINEAIIDLPKLAAQSEIQNSDIILAIFEICLFNKKYNYECSNNTKAFWDRVVGEELLKKIFKNFKSETLRKYWKIIRVTGENEKFIEIVKKNDKFINNPVFKLLPIINGISSYIQLDSDEQSFQDYFTSIAIKEKKQIVLKEDDDDVPKKKEKIQKKVKITKIEEKEESEKEEIDPRIAQLDELVNKMMKISKYSREEVFRALYGTSGNIKNAYLYLMDNIKYEKYFFKDTDDYIIKNLKDKDYYNQLLEKKGEELIKERKKFLSLK